MIPIRDNVPSRTLPIVNTTIIVVNAVVFVYEWVLPEQELRSFIHQFALIPGYFTGMPFEDVLRTQWWRPFTSMFMHGGWLHVIMNMWALWIFGDNVEDRIGHVTYVFFYLVCGLAAAVAHIFMSKGSPVPTLGASGAVAGIMGAYLMLYPRAKVYTLVPFFILTIIPIPAFIYLGIWFLLQLQSGILTWGHEHLAGIAFWAHAGGFAAGAVLVLVATKRKRYRTWHRDEYRAP